MKDIQKEITYARMISKSDNYVDWNQDSIDIHRKIRGLYPNAYTLYNSKRIKISMRCSKTNIPMAIEDIENKIFGFQFHPESFLTENGDFIIKKILSA